MESLTSISCRRSFNPSVGAFTRLSQLASRNPIRYGPHDQDDQNADYDIIGDCHDTPALVGIGEPIMIARATIPQPFYESVTACRNKPVGPRGRPDVVFRQPKRNVPSCGVLR